MNFKLEISSERENLNRERRDKSGREMNEMNFAARGDPAWRIEVANDDDQNKIGWEIQVRCAEVWTMQTHTNREEGNITGVSKNVQLTEET